MHLKSGKLLHDRQYPKGTIFNKIPKIKQFVKQQYIEYIRLIL